MKEAIITDLDGLLADVALADDSETGYSSIYETAAVGGEPELIGYRVAVPVPAGLYRPRFDKLAYDEHQEALRLHLSAVAAWEALPDHERSEWPQQPNVPAFWVEGLTPEEIASLQSGTHEISPVEQLQADNALLLLDLAETQARQAQTEQDNAILLLAVAELESRQRQMEQDYAALRLAVAEREVS